jgi:hypothetical protein
MIETKKLYEETSQVEVFIDGASKGVFPTPKMAQKFIDNYVLLSKSSDIIKDESSGVSQKNDEPIAVKRRGRPKKADNDRASTL